MNILIFEDEKYNYDLLCQMLTEQMPECYIIGPLSSIEEGKRFFADNTEKIDIIIADIQLNDGLSFYALSDAPADVPVIFTTAYEEYALKAFEYNSLSYLLKPVDEDELREAIRKAQQRLITDEHREELYTLLSQHMRYRERLLVNTFNGERVIPLSKVRYFFSEQKSTFAHLMDGTSYEVHKSLGTLEEELNPRNFMRVNRKYIVPQREIVGFESISGNRELLKLQGEDAPEIIISRDKKKIIHSWMEE